MQRVELLEKTLMLGKIEGKRRCGWQSLRWLDSRPSGHKSEQISGDSGGQRNLACYIVHGLQRLGLSDRTITTET